MKTSRPVALFLFLGMLGFCGSGTLCAQEKATSWTSEPLGNQVSIAGRFHTPVAPAVGQWKVESPVIIGEVVWDAGQLFQPRSAPARIPARLSAQVPVRSLVLLDHDCTTWLHHFLRRDQHPAVRFELEELTLEPGPGGETVQGLAQGRLALAGVTNRVSVPLTLTRSQGGQITLRGAWGLDLSQYLTLPKDRFRLFSDKPPTIHDCDVLLAPRPDTRVEFTWRLRPRKA